MMLLNILCIKYSGWRRQLMHWYRYFGYGVLYSSGFNVTIIGKQATRKEAPVLVGAPHSSFVEVMMFRMFTFQYLMKAIFYF